MRPRRSSAGRATSSRHGQERPVRVPGLAAHLRGHRRRPEGRWAEEADRGRPIPGHRQDDLGWRRSDRLPDRRSPTNPPATPSSTIRAPIRRRCATRTGRSTSPWSATRRPASSPARCPITGPRSSTSSATRSRPRSASRSRPCSAWAARSPRRSTAYVYDWNLLPIGQALWLKELRPTSRIPPMQDPATYNLTQVMQQVQKMKTAPQRVAPGRLVAGAPNGAPASRPRRRWSPAASVRASTRGSSPSTRVPANSA